MWAGTLGKKRQRHHGLREIKAGQGEGVTRTALGTELSS